MTRLLVLTRYQFVILSREPGYWVVSLALAVLAMLAFGYLATDPTAPRLGLVDLAENSHSQQVVAAARSTDGVAISDGSRGEELEALMSGERWGVVVLGPDFDGTAGPGVEVWTLDAADYERTAVAGLTRRLLRDTSAGPLGEAGREPREKPLREEDPVRFIDAIVAGQVGLALMFGNLFAASLIGWWRDDGALRRLAAAPISSIELLGSQLVAFGALSFAQAAILLTMARVLFGVSVRGDYVVLAGALAAGILAFLALWYMIVSVVRSGISANAVSSLLAITMLFMGGSFLPVDQPAFLRPVLSLLPITNLNEALRSVINRGEGLADVAPELAVLLAWSLGLLAVSTRLFRWTVD